MGPIWFWAIALAGYAAFWLTDFRRQARKLPKLIEKAKSLGCPITVEDFKSIVAVEESENAAGIYRELIEEFVQIKETDSKAIDTIRAAPISHGHTTPEQASACRSLQPFVEIVQRAAQFRSNRTYSLDSASSAAEDRLADPIRLTTKVVLLNAKRQAELADWDEMKKSILLARRLVQHSFYEPTILSWLVHVSQEVRRLQALGGIARVCWNDSHILEWLQSEAINSVNAANLLPCVKSEVAYMIRYTEHLRESGVSEAFSERPPFPLSIAYFQSRQALDAYLAVGLASALGAIESWPELEDDYMKVGIALQPIYDGGNWIWKPSNAWGSGSANPTSALHALEVRQEMTPRGISLLRDRLNGYALPRNLIEFEMRFRLPNHLSIKYRRQGDDFELVSGNLRF